MSLIDNAFKQLAQNPTSETLESVTTQIETLTRMLPRHEMKAALLDNMGRILREHRFDHIRKDETMLRLYKVVIAYSDNMGGNEIFKQLRKKGHFNNSLKFYVLWAEECGKEKSFDDFKTVLKLARDTLSTLHSISNIEAGFRDLVDEYFNGEAGDLFSSPDDTMNLFRVNPVCKGSKMKRRSSVCFLQQVAPKNVAEVPVFGPKTRSKIRREFVDAGNTFGVSPEEYRFAQWKDNFSEDVDTNVRRDSGVVGPRHQPTQNDWKAREEVENRMNARRRHLSPLSEGNADDEEEKRSRLYSPLVATKDAQRPPLRDSGLENIPTITLSSDTKSMSAKDASYHLQDDSLNENEKLKLMSAGRGASSRFSSNSTTTSSVRTAKSTDGLDLLAENNHLEAHAMFSDTVHLGPEKTMMIGQDSMLVSERARSLAPTQSMASDFSVLCDPDPTMTMQQPQEERPKKNSGLNMIYDEKSSPVPPEEEQRSQEPTRVMELAPAPKPAIKKELEEDVEPQMNFRIPKKSVQSPAEDFEYDFVSGLNMPSRGMIVTSTPAHNVPYVNIDDYFGNKRNETQQQEEEEEQQPQFVVPSSSTYNKMIRRKSQAASALAPQLAAPPAPTSKPPTAPPKAVNSSIDCLSDNLGRRLSIGADEIRDLILDEAETTGCVKRRRSEIIKKGDINPWDEPLRKKIMGLVRSPMNMHEFPERAPKLQAQRDCEVGGEVLHIQSLIGQGGYAKVYRALTEEKKKVAVKYEVPSCAWEVYICDQMRNRLIRDGDRQQMTDSCIMKVMDAYVFSTASLLVNEYHEYGNLLEYVNNMKDPNWHITCFLLTQLARILKEVHACKVIHGDIKPDNFMITRKIDPNWGKDALLSNETFVIKLIDWGRAIDMLSLPGHTFKGRAGTEGFDCPEMIDGRPWHYQTDYFGFAASMAVLVTGKYAELEGEQLGEYEFNMDIKRRNVLRDTIYDIVKKYLNIESCDALPDWNETIQQFAEVWDGNFQAAAWRQSAGKFNDACDLAAASHQK
ncbi:unnamed protein product [Caenorhabditis brenneri]